MTASRVGGGGVAAHATVLVRAAAGAPCLQQERLPFFVLACWCCLLVAYRTVSCCRTDITVYLRLASPCRM
jgi:hypothetical protein